MSHRDIRRYTFKRPIPAGEIEETLLLAVLAAEGLHGQPRVRLEAGYTFDKAGHACVIDSGSEVGRDICCIFAGFAIREFGADAFQVSRRGSAHKSHAVAADDREACNQGSSID